MAMESALLLKNFNGHPVSAQGTDTHSVRIRVGDVYKMLPLEQWKRLPAWRQPSAGQLARAE
jgi:hypothetical protein